MLAIYLAFQGGEPPQHFTNPRLIAAPVLGKQAELNT
jgi:hypothetical protein